MKQQDTTTVDLTERFSIEESNIQTLFGNLSIRCFEVWILDSNFFCDHNMTHIEVFIDSKVEQGIAPPTRDETSRVLCFSLVVQKC